MYLGRDSEDLFGEKSLFSLAPPCLKKEVSRDPLRDIDMYSEQFGGCRNHYVLLTKRS